MPVRTMEATSALRVTVKQRELEAKDDMVASLVVSDQPPKDRPTNMPVLITRCKSHADVVLSLNKSKHQSRVDVAKAYALKLEGLSGEEASREASEVLGTLTATENAAKSQMQRFETAILALKEKASDCREEAKLAEMKDDIMKMVVEWRQRPSTKEFEQALETAKLILDNIEMAGKKQAVAAASASAPVAPLHSIVMEMVRRLAEATSLAAYSRRRQV